MTLHNTVAGVSGLILMTLGLVGFTVLWPVGIAQALFYIVTGAAGIYAASKSASASVYFAIAGLAFAVIAALGFISGYGLLLAMPVTSVGSTVHAIIAALFVIMATTQRERVRYYPGSSYITSYQ